MGRTRDNSYKAFTINTSEVRYKAGEGSDAPLQQDTTRTLANLDRILGGLEKVIRSTTGEQGFTINRNRIKVDGDGVGSVQFFAKKEFEERIKDVIKYYENKSPLINENPSSLSSTMRVEDAIKYTFERDNILGQKAISKFIVEADKAGGKAEVLPSTEAGKDRVRATLFATEEEMKDKSATKLFNETFPEARALSKVEESKRDIKYQEKLKKEQDKIEKSFHTDPGVLDDEVNRMLERARKEEENDKTKSDILAEATKARRLVLIISKLTLLTNITRRILTATLARASEEKKNALEAKNLGVSRESARQANASDSALGLEEGTTLKAIESIQSATGTLAGLDTAKVEELSRVLGEGTVKAINVALGKNDPESALGLILNEYFKRGAAGINSFGVHVGQYQAQRELASALEKAGFNDIATILRNMFYVNDTGIYKGMITGENAYEDYKNLYNAADGGLSPADRQKLSELGQVVDRVKTSFDVLNENIKSKLMLSIGDFVNKLDKLNLGKSATDIAQKNSQSVSAFESVISETAVKSKEGEDTFLKLLKENKLTLDESSGFDSLDELKGELRKRFPNLDDKQQAYYDKLRDFFKTDEGLKALSYLADAEINEVKHEQAKEELKEGREKGNVHYSGEQYTSANLLALTEDVIDNPQVYTNDLAFAQILLDMQRSGEARFTFDEVYSAYMSQFFPNGIKKGETISWSKKIQGKIDKINKQRKRKGEDPLTHEGEVTFARAEVATGMNPVDMLAMQPANQVNKTLKERRAKSLSNNVADAMIRSEALQSEEYRNIAEEMASQNATFKSAEVTSYSAKDKNAVVKVMFVDSKGDEVAKSITFRTDVPKDTTNYNVTVDETGKKVSNAYENSSSE